MDEDQLERDNCGGHARTHQPPVYLRDKFKWVRYGARHFEYFGRSFQYCDRVGDLYIECLLNRSYAGHVYNS